MLKIFRRGTGHRAQIDADGGVWEVRMPFTEPEPAQERQPG